LPNFPEYAAAKLLFPRKPFVRFQYENKVMANETENNTKSISRSEKTNAKNQENVHIANTIVASVGDIYQPTNSLIAKAALLEFETNFTALTNAVLTAQIAEQAAVDAQLTAFKPVSKKVTLIMKAVRSQNLDELFVEGLQSDVYRLNAIRINKSTPDTAPDTAPKTASVSRRSYAGVLESLGIISEKLKNPAYNPNEPEFKSTAITAWVAGLQTTHNNALDKKVATRSARNTRNAYVYNDTDGLLPRMTALKNYLGYILDKDDPRLKQLKSLKFVDNTK